MSPRRTPPRRQRSLPPLPATRRIETGPDGFDYEVRAIPAARAIKNYRCPGCDHEIRSGSAHLVVWPAGLGEQAMEDQTALAHTVLDAQGHTAPDPETFLALEFECIRVDNIRKLTQQAADYVRNLGRTD